MAEEPQSAAGISDEELSAYLDGSLAPFRRAQVEAALRADPHLARKLKVYRAQEAGLRQLSSAVLEEPVPDQLLEVVRRPRPAAAEPALQRRWSRALWPVAASLLVGVALGWLLRSALQQGDDSLLEPFLRQAVASHELFLTSEDLDRLRETDASELVAEVQSPFRTPIRIPQLLGGHYRPAQFRAVEGGGGPALEVAYVSDDDGLTSLLIRPHSDRDDLPVRFAEVDGRSVLYWLDGPLIYALVSDGGEQELREMARGIYASTASGGSWQPPDTLPAQPAATRP